MQISDLEVDSVHLRATRAGRVLDLTAKEFSLLSLLIQRAGEVVSRTLIAHHVWQADFKSKSTMWTFLCGVCVKKLTSRSDQD